MFSKIKFLFVVFAIHWLEGHGYFFRRRESTPLTSDSQIVSSTPNNHNEYRMSGFSWIQPGQQTHQAPVANDGHVAASIPLPIAIQLPHQFIPLTVFPTIAQIQPVSKGHHHHHSGVFPQPVAPTPNTTPTPFVKFSPYETYASYQLPAAPATLQTIRFVPCLCGGSKDDRWSKTNYQANAQFSNNVPLQAIQLLPCYCPLVRDVDSQYGQPVVVSSTDSSTNNGPSTASTKF